MNPRRLHSLMTCLLLAWMGCAVVHAAPTLKDVRLVRQAQSTQVVLELSEVTPQKVFTLDNPARVVIDLPATALGASLPVGVAPVKNIRAGKRDNGDLRIVLDVSADIVPRTSWLTDGAAPRLLVELGAPGAPAAPPGAASDSTLVATATPTPAVAAPAEPVVLAPPPVTSTTAPPPVKSVSSFKGSRDLIIAIDAGHGGEDPGAIGPRGTREKNVTLAIARLLKERIDAEPGMRAELTREADHFVPLRDRINRARQMQADMFISIHADAVANSKVTGSSVYTLSFKGATNEAARMLADRENAADLVGGVSLDNKSNLLASVLLDLTQGASMSASLDAASRVLRQLDRIGDTHHSDVQQAGFVVLKSPDIPSMLVETAFITNPAEEARLNSPQHRAKLADAILTGVREYFYNNTPPGTRLAQIKATRQVRN